MRVEMYSSWGGRLLAGIALSLSLAGCATMPGWLASSGASREQVMKVQDDRPIEGITLIDVNDGLARKLAAGKALSRFSDVFYSRGPNSYRIGAGDIIEVSVWETPPALLFATSAPDPTKPGPVVSNSVTFPDQLVTVTGTISVPFVGYVRVEGRTTQEVETDIAKRLRGKANDPQVLVQIVKNNSSTVTVVGEVTNSLQMPLTPKGERLLDAIAASGGVKETVSRMAVQLTRGNVTSTMALDSIIRDPQQNVVLKPGDVVTALYQPQSFSVLGATGKNEEIPFEAQGISLAQALARSGGLNDTRADARGVFIFRFEDPKLVAGQAEGAAPAGVARSAAAPGATDSGVPVVYQVDLRDPRSFFVTQNFPIQNHDVIYVSNAPAAEFNKFLRLVVSVAVPGVALNRDFQ